MSLFLNTNLFLSTHVNRIDAKGRVSFPATFRQALAARNSQGIVIFRSLIEPAVEGMTIERLQAMSAALDNLPPFAPQRAHFEKTIFGNSQELQVDKEGRCSLPKALLDEVGIAGEAAFLGCGSTFQIWEPGALARSKAEAAAAYTSGAAPFPTLPPGVL